MTAADSPGDFRLPLTGAGGEPVSFRATIASHGLAWLPPYAIDPDERFLRAVVRLRDGSARMLTFSEEPAGFVRVAVAGRRPGARTRAELETLARAMFALDDDLSAFYARAAGDEELRFVTGGFGRFLRSPYAFDDVVRTICTTNCAWSATARMIGAFVRHLGTPAAGTAASTDAARAFPSPERFAATDDAFFRDVARCGYRGAYVRTLAGSVAARSLDLEAWRAAPRSELPDAELERRLLALPGVGPYAAAHVMMLFGRHSRLVLDSWTRPRFAQLRGKKTVADAAIVRRFARYGENAGLAFWLFLWKARHLGEERRA